MQYGTARGKLTPMAHRAPTLVTLRTTIDPMDLRDSAAIGYAQAVTRLYAARARYAAAVDANDGVGRARAVRSLHAAGDEADRLLAELLATAELVAQAHPDD